MKEELINQYVSRINYNDIDSFARKNNIILNSEATNFIYYQIKNNYKNVIYNPDTVFSNLKTKVDYDTYNKIHTLYNIYKSKYQSFL